MIPHFTHLFSTYSIVARDPQTGQLGVAVQTHQMGVGRVVPWLLPGVGAIATQAWTNISFGPLGLAMLREGVAAPKVVQALAASDDGAHNRQFAVVDANGSVGVWTGKNTITYAAHHIGSGYSTQANMMSNATVVDAMANAYENAAGDLAARMMTALQAAQRHGGDIRGMQSAALKVVSGNPKDPSWRSLFDLRVDEHAAPLTELARLLRLRRAENMDNEGLDLLKQGQPDRALEIWAEARALAPELEELPFWQAVALSDEPADIQTAVEILKPALNQDPRRDHWLDLLNRLQACGIIQRPNAAKELIAQLAISK